LAGLEQDPDAVKAADARKYLRSIASEKDAASLKTFFKTGKGQYAEGDQFIGIRSVPMRDAAQIWRDLPHSELDILLRSCIHEHRMLALQVLQLQYKAADARRREQIHRFYLARTHCVNNWDLVDDSAALLVGKHLFDKKPATIHRLSKSPLLWERRIAIVATHHFIRQRKFDLTLQLAERLLDDEHDLMHKAAGWMLREVGKRDEKTLRRFLERFAPRMPRTMLRYAIERFTPAQRKAFLQIPPAGGKKRPVSNRARKL
jgi:3-methyladenine DNA glycosylase AlkD